MSEAAINALMQRDKVGLVNGSISPEKQAPRLEAPGESVGSLVIITKSVDPPTAITTPDFDHSIARARRFYRQAVAKELLPGERVASCMAFTVPGRNVEVWHNPRHMRAHVCNVAVCGSLWTCPVCAAKISERRRVDLKAATASTDLNMLLVTFTLQHSKADKLAALLQGLNESYRATKNGPPWRRFKARFGIVGYMTGLEFTWSAVNGWHPHKHALFFLDQDADLEEVKAALTRRFTAMLSKRGFYGSRYHAVDVQQGEAAGNYVNKWGLEEELTKATVKKARVGFSPWQLLDKAGEGKAWAAALFQEYAAATKGKRQLVPSRSLKSLLDFPDKSDRDLATERREKGEVLLAQLRPYQWDILYKSHAIKDLLNAADCGDLDLIAAFLADYGLKLEV